MSIHSIKWIKETTRTNRNVLFIGRPAGQLANQLYDALGRCGTLSVSLHPDSKLISTCTAYSCYVLDADYLGDVTEAMQNILFTHPEARILIVSDSYDWEDALNAFRLGAIDVIRTPPTDSVTHEIINYVLKQELPRRNTRDASV